MKKSVEDETIADTRLVYWCSIFGCLDCFAASIKRIVFVLKKELLPKNIYIYSPAFIPIFPVLLFPMRMRINYLRINNYQVNRPKHFLPNRRLQLQRRRNSKKCNLSMIFSSFTLKIWLFIFYSVLIEMKKIGESKIVERGHTRPGRARAKWHLLTASRAEL